MENFLFELRSVVENLSLKFDASSLGVCFASLRRILMFSCLKLNPLPANVENMVSSE